MYRIVQVKDVAELNIATYKKDEFPTNIQYLDTSSLKKNIVENFQFLNINTDVIPSRAQRKIKKNTILYSTVRPNQEHFGIFEKLLDNIVVSTGFTTLDVIDDEINPKYLFYLLTQPHITEYLHTIATNSVSAYPSISPNDLGNLKFRVPELSTQQKIASVLSALDSKIELNNRINAELEAMAKTLYDYWFVQFDFPDKNGKPYKTSSGKMVWNEELKREIPEGWEVRKIGKILKTSLGGTPSTKVKEYWENGKISWLNSGEIANFPIIDSELKITEAAIKNSATDLLPKGSVMLSITRHLRPSILGIDACANQSVIGILEKDDIKCYFLYPYLQNEIPRLMEMRSGAQQPHINKEIIDESFILLPNNETEILKKYNAQVGHFYESIINKAFQNQKLTELRDWLLPMLMNGQVKVN